MTQPVPSARLAATRIIAELTGRGYTAYLAGGCVRDALLGQRPKDYDVATDAKPDEVLAIFPKSTAVGAAFGVVIVYTPAPMGQPRWATEVATFRAEGAYSDGRRPDSVRFTTDRQDAQRRDFTINGLFAQPMADDPQTQPDRIIDYVNGLSDLDAGIIRAIGDPGDRFSEDYLRMLRAVRFAARLGFCIEPKTSAAIRANARYLGQISRERIGQELLAMLAGPRPALALRLLQEHKLDAPTLNEDPDGPDLAATQRLGPDAAIPTQLAAWLIDRHGLSTPHGRIVTRWRKALSLSNEHRDELNRLLKLLEELAHWEKLDVAAKKRLASKPSWGQSLMLLSAVGKDAGAIEMQVKALQDDGIGLSPEPLLTGEDLIAKGLEPGPAFKTLLDDAYDRQLEGNLTTKAQALAWLKE